jgi:hypothetical protein
VKEIDVMSVRATFARALAALAVTGVAIAGTAGGAGAAGTSPEPTPVISLAPGGVTVDLGTDTVVTIGGPTAPRPGVHVTVPVDGQATAHLGRPATGPAPLATPTAPVPAPDALPPGIRLVDADIAAHVCLVAALLGGDAGDCATPGPAAAMTPSGVADAMANAVLCAQVAVLGSDAMGSCDGGTTGAPTTAPSVLGLVTDVQACVNATVLGTADTSGCATAGASGEAASGAATSPSTPNGAATLTGTGHGCLGIAVLADDVRSACAAEANAGGGQQPGDSATDRNGATTAFGDTCLGLVVPSVTTHDGCPSAAVAGSPRTLPLPSVVGAESTGAPTLVADASLRAPNGSGNGSDLAFSGSDSLLLGSIGLGAIGAGIALRQAVHLGLVR